MNDLAIKAVVLVLCVAAPFAAPQLPVSTPVKTALVAAACLVGPWALASVLAGLLRMKQFMWKIAVVFYAAMLALPLLRLPESMKLGIDLSGGTILVYEINTDELAPDARNDPQLMQKMVAAIIKRINPSGVEDVTVRPVGADRLEVIVPGSDPQDVARYRRLITDLGNLEFRILADERKSAEMRRWIQDTQPDGTYPFPADVVRRDRREGRDRVVARWYPVSMDEATKKGIPQRTLEVLSRLSGMPADQIELEMPLSELVKRGMSLDGMWEALVEAFKDQRMTPTISLEDRRRVQSVADLVQYVSAQYTISLHGEIAWYFNPDPEGGLMVLVVQPLGENEDRDRLALRYPAVTGEYLRRAMPQTDTDGSLAVSFVLDSRGAILFRRLTLAYKPEEDKFQHRLAILLNNQIQSAPNLREPITDGAGQISGDFSMQEIEELIAVLDAGALPAALNTQPASQYQIGPTLGSDTIEKGAQAIIGAMCVVLVFMVVYYWFAGGVADVALLLNLLMTLGFMSIIQANLTLPGLAGLVLSVGMSVDANVLIFERIREEQARGATFRMAIRNGFDRATRAIVDANVTTLLTAVILYAIGTDQVKGFAVTLILGILMSMYTALYVSRLVFTLGEQKRWLRGFAAMDLIGKPSIDFLGKLKFCAAASLVLIVVGMAGFFGRGVNGNLDIDFTGGTQVLVRFNEPNSTEDVRNELSDLPDLSVAELRIGNDPAGLRFDVRTSQQDVEAVKEEISNVFGERLARIHMQYELVNGPPPGAGGQEAAGGAEADAGNGEQPAEALEEPPASDRYRWALTFDKQVPVSAVEELFDEQLAGSGLQNVDAHFQGRGDAEAARTLFTRIDVTTSAVPVEPLEKILSQVQASLAKEPIFEQTLNFGGRVAHDMQIKALWAILLSLAGIVAYLWIRFQKAYFGIAAVVALVHDVCITLGMVALSFWLAGIPFVEHFKINLPMIAGFLTLIGYSLNDTIVTFDRLREVRGKSREITPEMVNLAVNQTLSRTLLTSFTTFIVVAILYFAGGEGVRGFAFCLVVGIITGTYSSVYIASPTLLWLSKQPIFAGPEQRRLETARK
jgi:SecD/SecF fusion protein